MERNNVKWGVTEREKEGGDKERLGGAGRDKEGQRETEK